MLYYPCLTYILTVSILLTAPASPESVIFNNYSETSLNVSWTSPDITTSSIAYMVQVVGDLSHNDHTQNTFYKFLNLTSGTMYNVSIIAYFNDSSSENKTTLQSDLSFSSTYTSKYSLFMYNVSVSS